MKPGGLRGRTITMLHGADSDELDALAGGDVLDAGGNLVSDAGDARSDVGDLVGDLTPR